MKRFTKLTFLLLLLLLLSFVQVACNGDDIFGCGINTSCTDDFRSVVVSIQDGDGNPVALDTYEVINLETGEPLDITFAFGDLQTAQETGMYPIANDGIFPSNQEVELQLRGFINEVEVITSDYVVATDCCHIGLVSGDTELILE